MTAAEVVIAMDRLRGEEQAATYAAMAEVREEFAMKYAALKTQLRELDNSADPTPTEDVRNLLRPTEAISDFRISSTSLKRIRQKKPHLFFRSGRVYFVRKAEMQAYLQLNPVLPRPAKKAKGPLGPKKAERWAL